MPSGSPEIAGRNIGGGTTHLSEVVSRASGSPSFVPSLESLRNTPGGANLRARLFAPTGTSATFAVSLASLRNIYTGASYYPRLDWITTPTFAPPGEEVLDVIAGTTMTQIGESQTLYLGLFEDATENKVSLPLPAGTVAQLTVESSVAAGSAGDYVYTVVKEGVAQSMTISMGAGATSGVTTANQVAVASGNTFSLKIVTASGAPSAYHRYSIKFTMS